MYIKKYSTTSQQSSKNYFLSNHTKYDLYNELSKDDMEISDQLFNDAKKGDTNALLKVAYLYDEKINSCNQKSLGWSLLAAVKECPEAQFKVASMLHLDSPGIKQDYKLAMEWYLQAAKNGSVDALNNIGCMYKNGHGVVQDYITAKKWFLRAPEHKVAQFNIGQLFDNGFGSFVDKKRAFDWYKKSADQGFEVAGEMMNKISNTTDNLQAIQQNFCMMTTKINQSQSTLDNSLEKLSELNLFFETKIREINQRESNSYKYSRKRARESDSNTEKEDEHTKKRNCAHKKFSSRWINHFIIYKS